MDEGSFTVDSIGTAECPVSLITQESKLAVERFNRAHFASEGGAALYGPDLSRWPAREVDALVIIQQERNREKNARHTAIEERVRNV